MEAFWESKSLSQMNQQEWESLCDGCAKCCLVKLENEDNGEVSYTDVSCKLLDLQSCRCTQYAERVSLVPNCLKLDKNNMQDWQHLPSTCAYRLLSEGKNLPNWHPLLDNTGALMKQQQISVAGRVMPETEVDEEDLEDHIVSWAN